MPLSPNIALHFRDSLRTARADALRDSEAFEGIVFAVERLGQFLVQGKAMGLHRVAPMIRELVANGPLALAMAQTTCRIHTPFEAVYDLVREARNSAFHEGAYARHLTARSVELALILEDALMAHMNHVGDFMVQGMVVASAWQPVSFVRQTMLTNAFSFLPVWLTIEEKEHWFLVSDHAIATYLRGAEGPPQRKTRLATALETAVASKELQVEKAFVCTPDSLVSEVLVASNGLPVLIHGGRESELIGIAAPHDLL
jgi:hypothetical protein